MLFKKKILQNTKADYLKNFGNQTVKERKSYRFGMIRGRKSWSNFHFWVNYPFKQQRQRLKVGLHLRTSPACTLKDVQQNKTHNAGFIQQQWYKGAKSIGCASSHAACFIFTCLHVLVVRLDVVRKQEREGHNDWRWVSPSVTKWFWWQTRGLQLFKLLWELHHYNLIMALR